MQPTTSSGAGDGSAEYERAQDRKLPAPWRVRALQALIDARQEALVARVIGEMAARHAQQNGGWQESGAGGGFGMPNPSDHSPEHQILAQFPAHALRAMCEVLRDSAAAEARLGAARLMGLYLFALPPTAPGSLADQARNLLRLVAEGDASTDVRLAAKESLKSASGG